MLTKLHIRNFALIEELDICFSSGYTVFTGETGSGKSIILGALNLILGERADYGVIRDASQKTIVEAIFDLKELKLQPFFQANDLDFSEETLIRREIASNGKSRAFINDTPVSLAVLNELTSQLIKIHSQYHTYSLKSKKFQLELVDDLAGVQLKNYQADFKAWKQLQAKIQQLEEQLQQQLKDTDYVQFQIEELSALKLENTNFEEIEQQLNQLENATEIIQQFANVSSSLDGEYGIISPLRQLVSQLNKTQNLHPKLAEFNNRLQAVISELQDISEDASDTAETISIDGETQTLLESQLDFYNRQLTKHHVKTQVELAEILQNYLASNSSTEQLESELNELKNTYQQLSKTLQTQADTIHQQRVSMKNVIEKNVENLLEQLKLNGARFVIQLTKTDTLSETGNTEIEILFTSNKGSEPKAIDKAASGGELSRLMLSLERLLSEKVKLPTLLLDEIDTGVSGEVALKIGEMLREMGQNMQLFSITHLPQVAAKGQHHFKVYKTEQNGVMQTFVKQLDSEEKLVEIAGLMSGENVNSAAVENAKILMQ
ncbi:MAG TPA: DNA repair protein RecN [Crocinitomicaceae bacterium]|nr:DNA repair protein RecN [Crocinitomicaceae bacterium]